MSYSHKWLWYWVNSQITELELEIIFCLCQTLGYQPNVLEQEFLISFPLNFLCIFIYPLFAMHLVHRDNKYSELRKISRKHRSKLLFITELLINTFASKCFILEGEKPIPTWKFIKLINIFFIKMSYKLTWQIWSIFLYEIAH